MPDDRPVSVG